MDPKFLNCLMAVMDIGCKVLGLLFFSLNVIDSNLRLVLGLGAALLRQVVKDVAELCPARLGDQDRVPEVALDLGHVDVPAQRVLLAGEDKVLVLDPEVAALGRGGGGGGGLLDFPVVELFDQLPQVVVELLHPVRRDENLKPRVAPGEGLGNLQEAPAGVFL